MENVTSLQTFLLILFLSIMLMILISIKWISFHSKNNKNLPPSPQKFPVIGNLHQLGSSPHRTLQAMSQKYGQLMLLNFGSVPTLIASSAESAQEIMKTHDLVFCSRPKLRIPSILFYDCRDVAFSPYGERVRQLKSFMVTHLLSNVQVKSFQNVREKERGFMIRALEDSYESSVDIGELVHSQIVKIVYKAAFGRMKDGVEVKLINLLNNYTNVLMVFGVGSYVPWLSWVDQVTGLVGKTKKAAKEFDEFLEGVIEEHVNQDGMEHSRIINEGLTFIEVLLNANKDGTMGFTIDKDVVKAILLDVFVGGIDTTSKSTEWVICELIRHPRVMKKLQHEITETVQGRSMVAEEDLEKMHYLKAIIKKSMRLHMPAPLLAPRISTQDVKLMGYDISAGTQVIINSWAIARDPNFWEEPEEFRPERFVESSISYKGVNYGWLVFGGGRRICPGIQFAGVGMELAIANIVYKFNLALPKGLKPEDLDMSEKFSISVGRNTPLLVTISPRF
ncbi:cytochrome P450 Tp4149-like [Rutidosis leptorrhynchoides]|uniref:cytochrome P450 Tp4149-like n=1 Tax=Rutidosis leptorrhynchoides TaxID=125765 RepID=UPI003A9A4184